MILFVNNNLGILFLESGIIEEMIHQNIVDSFLLNRIKLNKILTKVVMDKSMQLK